MVFESGAPVDPPWPCSMAPCPWKGGWTSEPWGVCCMGMFCCMFWIGGWPWGRPVFPFSVNGAGCPCEGSKLGKDMACKLDGLLGLSMAIKCSGKIGKSVVEEGCGEEAKKVGGKYSGKRVSLCDALWGARQGIDGDGEAPTATILGGTAGSHSTAAPRPHFDRTLLRALRTGAMRPELSHRSLPLGDNMSWTAWVAWTSFIGYDWDFNRTVR